MPEGHDTLDADHVIILRSASPDSFNDLKKVLDEESKLVKAQNISSSFYVNDISINRETLSVRIAGTLQRSVADKPLKPIKTAFQIDFDNQNGLLLIKQFFEVKNP